MNNQSTTTFLWARSTAILAHTSFLSLIFLNSCTEQPWQGTFVAPAQNDCLVLESIQVHGDNSADIKYKTLDEIANFEGKFDETAQVLYVAELQRIWAFKLSNDTLFEVSGQDPHCYLIKQK